VKVLFIVPYALLALSCAHNASRQEVFVQEEVVSQPYIIPQPLVVFLDSVGRELHVFHFVNSPESIRVTLLDGSEQLLRQVPAASGVRYENSLGYELWEHQGQCALRLHGELLFSGSMQ